MRKPAACAPEVGEREAKSPNPKANKGKLPVGFIILGYQKDINLRDGRKKLSKEKYRENGQKFSGYAH